MKKIFYIICAISFLSLTMFAKEQCMLISEQDKYWGQYVNYKSSSGQPQRSIGEIIMLKNGSITFYSHRRQKTSSFIYKDNYIEYQLGNSGKQRIFYDSSQNILYKKKPGKLFFIPEKIIYVPLDSKIAKKQIQEWLQVMPRTSRRCIKNGTILSNDI